MKILVIEGRDTIGGGQVMTKCICDVLSNKYHVEVFIPGNSSAPIAKLLKEYKQHPYPMRKYASGKKEPADYLKFVYNLFSAGIHLFNTLRKEKTDYIYVQHINMLPIVILVNIFFRIKIFVHIHVIHVDGKTRALVNWLLKSKYVVKIIGVSYYSLTQFSCDIQQKCSVIHNPVLLRDTYCPNKEELNIAAIGDVYYGKGQHVLLDAFNEKENNYKIHIIGNLVDSKYKKFLDENFPNVNVVYTGMINNVSDYLIANRIAAVVVASVVGFETFSLAMVEAWAQGIPTLATDDFGMKELVDKYLPQYKSDMLFPLGDSVELYHKINELLSNSNLYDNISKDVRKVIESHLNKQVFSYKLHEVLTPFCL